MSSRQALHQWIERRVFKRSDSGSKFTESKSNRPYIDRVTSPSRPPPLPPPRDQDDTYDQLNFSPAAPPVQHRALRHGNPLPPKPCFPPPPSPPQQQKLVFHCQLAQGSPTGIISDFSSPKELYERIAECYSISPLKILFCTLNTHKIDMSRLLVNQLDLNDFIFVHVAGQPKVVDIQKTNESLGLLITDNGAGISFIKAIRPGSPLTEIDGICVGDHIEQINGISMVGYQHFQVADTIRNIKPGSVFTLRLIEPQKSAFSGIDQRSIVAGLHGRCGPARRTLRLKKKGRATIEQADDFVDNIIKRINEQMESSIGVSDAELAQTIWEIGHKLDSMTGFLSALDSSDLRHCGFTDVLIFELWTIISDAKISQSKLS